MQPEAGYNQDLARVQHCQANARGNEERRINLHAGSNGRTLQQCKHTKASTRIAMNEDCKHPFSKTDVWRTRLAETVHRDYDSGRKPCSTAYGPWPAPQSQTKHSNCADCRVLSLCRLMLGKPKSCDGLSRIIASPKIKARSRPNENCRNPLYTQAGAGKHEDCKVPW